LIAKIGNCQRIQIEELLSRKFGLEQKRLRRSLAILALMAIAEE